MQLRFSVKADELHREDLAAGKSQQEADGAFWKRIKAHAETLTDAELEEWFYQTVHIELLEEVAA